MLDGVLQGEDTPLGLGLVTDVGVLLSHTDHDTLVAGRPTMEGKTALGASSPAKPALHMPEPLSTTRAATSSSHIFRLYILVLSTQANKSGGVQVQMRCAPTAPHVFSCQRRLIR